MGTYSPERRVLTKEVSPARNGDGRKWHRPTACVSQLPLTREHYVYLSLIVENRPIDPKRLTSYAIFQLLDEDLVSLDPKGVLYVTRLGITALASRGLTSQQEAEASPVTSDHRVNRFQSDQKRRASP